MIIEKFYIWVNYYEQKTFFAYRSISTYYIFIDV